MGIFAGAIDYFQRGGERNQHQKKLGTSLKSSLNKIF